ncbi:MAG: hypothetical protein ABUK01_08935 [Leptospirales bacterium]
MRAHAEMLEFSVGEKVSFYPPGQGELSGILVKYNKKQLMRTHRQHIISVPG